MLSAALTFGAFFVIVALGQMFVITLGPGNVDLVDPRLHDAGGHRGDEDRWTSAGAMILPGLAIALAVGLAVGVINYALIRVLAHPADHRHAQLQLHLPVRRDLVEPRPAGQTACSAGRLHHRQDRWASRSSPSSSSGWPSRCTSC